jgi:hypothetical protein
VVTRRRPLSSGRTIGGVALTNGPLGYLLRNRVYIGELNHRGTSHPGQHAPIIPEALFAAVQETLTGNRNGRRLPRRASGALLLGRLFDDRGNRMTPSTARKGPIRYRYYVSSVLAQGRLSEAGSVRRVSASAIEALVVEALRTAYPDDAAVDERSLIASRVHRVVLRAGSIDVHPHPDRAAPIVLPWSPPVRRRQRAILRPSTSAGEPERGIKAEARTVLLCAMARGRRWLAEVLDGSSLEQIALREGGTTRHVAKTIPLAFLAPDLVQALIEARLPRGFSTKRIGAPELEWARQWERLGLRR